jgi:hypothetical protein
MARNFWNDQTDPRLRSAKVQIRHMTLGFTLESSLDLTSFEIRTWTIAIRLVESFFQLCFEDRTANASKHLGAKPYDRRD